MGTADDIDPTEQWERFLAAKRADLRIQVVQRVIHTRVLAGMANTSTEITEYAAWLVIDALNSFDADAEQRAYAQGFRQGVAFQRHVGSGACST